MSNLISYVQLQLIQTMRRDNLYLQYDSYWWRFYGADGKRANRTVPGNCKTIAALERKGHLVRDGYKLRLPFKDEGSL